MGTNRGVAAIPANPILGKYILSGELVAVSGLHIGAQGAAVEIGGIDNPVIRDPISRRPYLPGSSLRGKLRTLHERRLNLCFDSAGGSGSSRIMRHECDDPGCPSCRLFGSAKGGARKTNLPGRLAVRDAALTEDTVRRLRAIDTGLLYTEWKFENGLDRITCAANPRQTERVPRGSVFSVAFVYTVNTDDGHVQKEDLGALLAAMRLLEDDSLGGSGSRGYGQVQFRDLRRTWRSADYYAGCASEEVEVIALGEVGGSLPRGA